MLDLFAGSSGLEEDPKQSGRDVLLMMNNTGESQQFILPPVAKSAQWRLVVDTASPSPRDAFPNGAGPTMPRSGYLKLPERSFRCYVGTGPPTSR